MTRILAVAVATASIGAAVLLSTAFQPVRGSTISCGPSLPGGRNAPAVVRVRVEGRSPGGRIEIRRAHADDAVAAWLERAYPSAAAMAVQAEIGDSRLQCAAPRGDAFALTLRGGGNIAVDLTVAGGRTVIVTREGPRGSLGRVTLGPGAPGGTIAW